MNKKYDIEVIQMSKYVKPVVEPATSSKWTLNGNNNEYYKYIKDCYDGSVTNKAIINAFKNYIYGEGLVSRNEDFNIYRYISKNDIKLMVLDYKIYGGFAVQVLWNSASDIKDKKPVYFKYLPIYKLGVNIDKVTQDVNGYWYSFDWNNQGKYKPRFFQRFDGSYKYDETEQKGEDVEICVVKRVSSDPWFSDCDYSAGLQYAELEMELANSSINHVKNAFQAGKIVNVPYVPETEELREQVKRKIISQTTGSTNTNFTIVGFSDNPDNKITIDNVQVTELNSQYQNFEEVAEKKLIVAHSAPPVLFSGTREGGGLGNNAEEIKTATQSLYRKHIYPMREDILDGLEFLFSFVEPLPKLEFKDFEEFVSDDKNNTDINNG